RVNGKLVREQLGTLAAIPKIEQARELARASFRQAQQGIHPAEERRRNEASEHRRREAVQARERDRLGAVLDRYLAQYGAKRWKPDYLKEVTRSFAADLGPLRDRPISDLTRRDLRDLLDA